MILGHYRVVVDRPWLFWVSSCGLLVSVESWGRGWSWVLLAMGRGFDEYGFSSHSPPPLSLFSTSLSNLCLPLSHLSLPFSYASLSPIFAFLPSLVVGFLWVWIYGFYEFHGELCVRIWFFVGIFDDDGGGVCSDGGFSGGGCCVFYGWWLWVVILIWFLFCFYFLFGFVGMDLAVVAIDAGGFFFFPYGIDFWMDTDYGGNGGWF